MSVLEGGEGGEGKGKGREGGRIGRTLGIDRGSNNLAADGLELLDALREGNDLGGADLWCVQLVRCVHVGGRRKGKGGGREEGEIFF